MDSQKFLEQWESLKKQLKEEWHLSSDLAIDEISGVKSKLIDHIEKRYGISREEAEKEVEAWLEEIESTRKNNKNK